MEYTEPVEKGYTIYSKSGCVLCKMVIDLLKKEGIEYSIIDCDEYLKQNRESFLLFINGYAGKNTGGFPKVFVGSEFIGCYKETVDNVRKNIFSDKNI